MAVSVPIAPSTSTKVRNPWGVFGLTLVTFGIYHLFWWYFINRELADYGKAHDIDLGRSPATSVLAVTLGCLLIVPPFLSIWNTGKRMAQAQAAAGVPEEGSGPLYFVLAVFTGVFGSVYLQYQLNKVWRTLS